MTKESNSSNIKNVVEMTTELAKAVPIYQDLIQPAAKEVGSALGTVAKTVNIALAPIAGIVWSYESIQGYISKRVSEKLKNIPEENIETPKISVAGPALEALRFTGDDEEELREMYANLLANALDKNTKNNVHSSFIEIIKQLSPQEALLLKFLSEMKSFPLICSYEETQKMTGNIGENSVLHWGRNNREASFVSNMVDQEFIKVCIDFDENLDIDISLDNFRRLQLIEIETQTLHKFVDNKWLDNKSVIQLQIGTIEAYYFSMYGRNFVKMCMLNSSSKCNTQS